MGAGELGRDVRTLVNDIAEAGYHAVPFDDSSLASGVYYHRLAADQVRVRKKVNVVKIFLHEVPGWYWL
ncbi:MAG TPA: hypothetical protein VGB89_00080 [Bacteroidota bacterium]